MTLKEEAEQLAKDRPTILSDDLYQWAMDAEEMLWKLSAHQWAMDAEEMLWKLSAQAAQPAQNEWKEAVIEQLAAHSMDAPVSDSPTVILAKIIHMAVLQATDPAIKAAQVPIYQYQLANGNWIDQTKESYDYNVRHGQATVRILYAAPSTKEGQQ